jgi:serine/threonine protein kinase
MGSTPTLPGHRDEPPAAAAPAGRLLLRELLLGSVIPIETWEAIPSAERDDLLHVVEPAVLLPRLVERGLLTQYQADRARKGRTRELVIGHYRILDNLGSGATAVVYRAEHFYLRRRVAVKVLRPTVAEDDDARRRFRAEMRLVAQLDHPNVVIAFDAGEVSGPDATCPRLPYLVMEYVAGQNLEELVRASGPLPVAVACGLAFQVASALAAAHEHDLVHRDVKPTNVRVTPAGRAKLLDFGLIRDFQNRITDVGVVIGTVDYMAPEQARDSHAVDIRADIFGLGATLYWCLTAELPFPAGGNLFAELARRQYAPPPSVRIVRPEVPAELDAVVGRMMAVNRDDRFPTPNAVMQALVPFLAADFGPLLLRPSPA